MAETPSVAEQERYIRQAAIQRGIDPNVAVRVARSEGLAQGVWQSNFKKGSIREPSYGPFQLLVGGPGTGFPKGLGNAFMRATGLDPRSKSSVFAQIDFALNAAAQKGWGAWYGAAKVGVDKWTGLRGAQPAPINREAVQIASLPADAPIPSPRQSLLAENAPIPANLPSVARPDNMKASGPSFPRQVMTAGRMPAPAPERFGGRGAGPVQAPVMAGFAPDPSRFGRTPMAPPAPATGGRVGSGSFSAPPDPARFGPPPSAPLPAMRMAAPNVPDPARLGQIAMGPQAAPVDRSVVPSNPGQLGGVRMSNPMGLGGPGGLMMQPPQAAPVQPQAQPPVQPPAPALPAPVTVQDMPVHQVEAGAPPMVPQAPRPPSGNTVEMDQLGNRSVTNKFGATTITTPGGNQSAGSLNMGQASIPSIPGPLGFSGVLGEGKPQGFGKTLGGGLLGARMGMMGGLPGIAVGGILGSLLGRELSKPGYGRLGGVASALGIGQQRFATGFPAAPKAPASFQPMTEAQHRDFLNSPGIRESAQAQSALSRGGGGLY
jgi:hypothetical protein